MLNEEQTKFWDRLKDTFHHVQIETNDQLLSAIIYSKLKNAPTTHLVDYFLHTAQKHAIRKQFDNFTYYDDLVQEAVTFMISHYHKFDETKGTNAYSYVRTICESAMLRFVHSQTKQAAIKVAAVERLELGLDE